MTSIVPPTMSEEVSTSDLQPEARKSYFPIRVLRVIRKSLEDDGLIGRVTESAIGRFIRRLPTLWIAVDSALWLIEHYLGKYFMNPVERMMVEVFQKKGSYSPLGQALLSTQVSYLQSTLFRFLAFEFCTSILYLVLEWLTIEEHEIAQREYEELKASLGDTEEEEKRDAKSNVFDKLMDSWPMRYFTNAAIAWTIFSMVKTVGLNAYEARQQAAEYADFENVDLTSVNPYRFPLPAGQDYVIRDRSYPQSNLVSSVSLIYYCTVLYTQHVLKQLSPTSVPTDNFTLYSHLIHNLETRDDISWRIYKEIEIERNLRDAKDRSHYHRDETAYSAYRRKTVQLPEEPFSIAARMAALHKHWSSDSFKANALERWDEESANVFLKPLLRGEPIEGNDQAPSGVASPIKSKAETYTLQLSEEDSAQADVIYAKWRKKYNREASYLKDHPPSPIGWFPIPQSPDGKQAVWKGLFADGKVEAGRSVSQGKLIKSNMWRPIYGSFHMIPFDWKTPGEAEDKDFEAIMDGYKTEEKIRNDRKKEQDEYIEVVKVKAEQAEAEQAAADKAKEEARKEL